jgi:hypothetical protein
MSDRTSLRRRSTRLVFFPGPDGPMSAIGRNRARSRTCRFASSLAFVTLFFAGAALSAGAGETVVGIVEGSTDTTTTSTDETTTDETTTAEVAEPVLPLSEPGPADVVVEPPAAPGEPAEPPVASPQPVAEVPSAPASSKGSPAKSSAPKAPTVARDPETREGGVATVWLYRILPDPTPPAARLSPAFARMLRSTSAKADVDWALVLGVLRARGGRGHAPASAGAVQALADQLKALDADERPRRAVRALLARRSVANRAIALSRYNRAVRLRALVTGLEAAKPRLARRVLNDERLDIYPGGRADVEQDKIDVRILVLMLYLAEAHGQVTVSSLETGHRLYSRPGVISAHVYGLAVDIAALGSKPIFGNQAPGGLTEKAVRNILSLPAELQPQQVISLLGLGGPSFPLGDHGDHIHVGY